MLILILALLIGIGVSFLFSASYHHAEKLGKPSLYFVIKQSIWIIIGLVIAFFISHISLDVLKKAVPWILLTGFILSILTFFPVIGEPISGARRWIFIFGQSFQPSEFAKFAIVCYLAYILSRKKEKNDDPVTNVLPPLIVVFIFVVIIYLQNDFSTAFFIFFIALAIFFIANVRAIYFILIGAIIFPVGIVLLFTKVYWVKKLMVFIKPELDPSGTGWQITQAHAALTRGGFLGKGLGNGVKKLGALPEAHSDFIFAVIGEEAGLFGILFIIALFVCFCYRGYLIAWKSEDPFKYYLSFGITSIIFFQAIVNMAVVAGLIPATGMPLPFFSLGGSSVLMTLIMTGILINISRGITEKNWGYR